MKIVHFNHSFYTGGVESLICGLLNGMSTDNDVTICTFVKMSPNEGLLPNLSSSVKYANLGNKRLTVMNKIFNIFKILILLLKEKYDVVHLHGDFNYYILSIFLLHKKIKFFYTVHSDAYMENGPMSQKILPIKKYFFIKKYIVPITISVSSKKSFSELYGCESKLIENGIPMPKIDLCIDPVKKYRFSPQTKVFTHVGRISIPKNQLVLCKVFKKIVEEGHDVVLLIIGPKEIDDIYIDISKYFSNRIIYLGSKYNVADYFYYSDAMCLPSIYEGLPITLLESLSVGCIPICSPVGGIVDVIQNGQNGILSASPRENDYYQSVRQFLLLSKNDIEAMKRSCRDSFNYYDVNRVVLEYLKCYKLKS